MTDGKRDELIRQGMETVRDTLRAQGSLAGFSNMEISVLVDAGWRPPRRQMKVERPQGVDAYPRLEDVVARPVAEPTECCASGSCEVCEPWRNWR